MDEATALILRQIQTDVRDVRETVDDNKHAVAKLWTEHRELTATVQGAQGDNGLRSDVRALEIWRADLEQWRVKMAGDLRHYIDVERKATCHGLAAIEEREGDEMKLKEANISARAVILAAVIPSGLASLAAIAAALIAAGVLG